MKKRFSQKIQLSVPDYNYIISSMRNLLHLPNLPFDCCLFPVISGEYAMVEVMINFGYKATVHLFGSTSTYFACYYNKARSQINVLRS